MIDSNHIPFFGLKTREANFFLFAKFFEYWFENCHGSYVEKLLSVWRMIPGCQNQPDLPNQPRQLKSHIAFSMLPTGRGVSEKVSVYPSLINSWFPIFDTNLWLCHTNALCINQFYFHEKILSIGGTGK